jgi:hypothetical protein
LSRDPGESFQSAKVLNGREYPHSSRYDSAEANRLSSLVAQYGTARREGLYDQDYGFVYFMNSLMSDYVSVELAGVGRDHLHLFLFANNNPVSQHDAQGEIAIALPVVAIAAVAALAIAAAWPFIKPKPLNIPISWPRRRPVVPPIRSCQLEACYGPCLLNPDGQLTGSCSLQPCISPQKEGIMICACLP